MRPEIDFETYSEAGYTLDAVTGKARGVGSQGKGGLPVVGTDVYAAHHSTRVLSLAYDMHDGRGPQLWVPELHAPPSALLDWVAQGGPVEAWNVTFEFFVWNLVCVRLYGWPPLPLGQCWCAMAKARRFSLPGRLAEASKVLGLPGKHKDGDRLIQSLTRPHSLTKDRRTWARTPETHPRDHHSLWDYNRQDVTAERQVSELVPELTPEERETWLVDQRINARGVQVDTEGLDNMAEVLEQATTSMTVELVLLTAGRVQSVSEVANLGDWMRGRGVPVQDMTAETVELWLGRPDRLPPDVLRVLQIRAELGSANVKKLAAFRNQVGPGGRLRNQYSYCGADRTGRWSAGGVQLQNITAKGPAAAMCEGCGKPYGTSHAPSQCPRCGAAAAFSTTVKDWGIDHAEVALEDMASRSAEYVRQIWGDVVATIGGCLRPLLTAAPGHDLVCCDFSAIEAVVQACLTGCQWRIEVFSTHGEIYLMSASKITGTPLEVYRHHKATTGQHHPDRKLGKVAELASGFGGWVGAWRNFGADDFMREDEIREAILAWRAASPEIVEMWGGQYRHVGPGRWDYRPELYGLEGAAIQAVQNPGQAYHVGPITYYVRGDILRCVLPSGRILYYWRPRLAQVADRLNRGPMLSLTYEGWNSNPTKGTLGWVRRETYGGSLFENVVQAVARDLQAEAMKRAEAAGYRVVMHTHDELCTEVPEGWGSAEELRDIMTQPPAWASWWPIRAAGWRHKRYQKD